MRHGLVRLDAVWGVGGPTRPVKQLVKKMTLLLHEYLSSDDVGEAQRCLVELEVPHFHHELVSAVPCARFIELFRVNFFFISS